MLTNWTMQSPDATAAFCKFHAEDSGEQLNPNKVSLYYSEESPYAGYRLVKLEISPHVIDRTQGTRKTVSSRKRSYALQLTSGPASAFKIIPLWQGRGPRAHNLYEINDLLQFKVNDRLFLKYMTLFGTVGMDEPFYFFHQLDDLDGFANRKEEIVKAIQTFFRVGENQRLEIEPDVRHNLLYGKAYAFDLPCIVQGQLQVSKCLLSQDGRFAIDFLNGLLVDGLIDDKEDYPYYCLDASAKLFKQINALTAKLNQGPNMAFKVLDVDNLQLWLLPLFLFQVLVMLLFGLTAEQGVIFKYFDELVNSTPLSALAFVLGILGVLTTIFRYVLVNIIVTMKRRIPSVMSTIAMTMQRDIQLQIKHQTKLWVLTRLALEHALKVTMSLSLVLYGISRFSFAGLPKLNFGQAVSTVLDNVPIAGKLAEWTFNGTAFASVPMNDTIKSSIGAVVSFFLGTIAVGIWMRAREFSEAR